MCCSLRTCCLVAALSGLLAGPAAVLGQPSSAGREQPPDSYSSRLTYDSHTGQWIEEAEPVPGTPEGDLALAKRRLARGEARQAGVQLRQWLRTHAYDSPLHPAALFYLGRTEFEQGNYVRAHAHYQEVINGWPGTEWADRALRGDFIVAEVFLSGQKRKLLGMPMLPADDEGLDILDDIIANHPHTALAEQALRTKADYYFREGEFELAEDAYSQLARDYPGGHYVPEAMLRAARAALASFPGVRFDDAALIEAEERFLQFREAFPQYAASEEVGLVLETIRAKQAEKEFRIAEYYERVRQFNAAGVYYRSVDRRWPDTTWAGLARSRLGRLGLGADGQAPAAETAKPETTDGPIYAE